MKLKKIMIGQPVFCKKCGEQLNLTRSGLFFQALRIIKDTKPKIAIAENVKNLTSKKFSEQFGIVLDSLESAGYNNYWQVLNAKDFGVPQNRERVFIVSIRKDIDTGCFKFPEGFELDLRLKDLLESEVDEKYYLSKSFDFIETPETKEQCVRLGNIYGEKFGTGYAGNVWDKNGLSPTLVTCTGGGRQPHIVEDLRIRKLTPLECWRLMGFDDKDYYKAEEVNSNTQLYKQAGNSIVVDVLEYLFKEIMEALDMKKIEDKVIVYECDDLINLEALKEKEPELYEELLADYPCESATYVFKNKTA